MLVVFVLALIYKILNKEWAICVKLEEENNIIAHYKYSS